MFIINSHSVHQFNFPDLHIYIHIYCQLMSLKNFKFKSYFFKLKAPSNKEWFKPWLEMKIYSPSFTNRTTYFNVSTLSKLIQDCLLDKKQEENTKEIYKIIEEIEKRYNQDLTLEIIAEQFHFHPNSLSRLFKRQTTISFYTIIYQKIKIKTCLL